MSADPDNYKDLRRNLYERELKGKRLLRPQTRKSRDSRSFRPRHARGQQRENDRSLRKAVRHGIREDLEKHLGTLTTIPCVESFGHLR